MAKDGSGLYARDMPSESSDIGIEENIEPFNQEKLIDELGELSSRLAKRKLRASVYIAGGAAMILAHRSSRTTFDVDVLFIDGHAAVLSIAKEMAKERNLKPNWFNNGMRLFMEHLPPFDKRAKTVFETRHLIVAGASPDYLAAMKIRAGRKRDIQDIKHLLDTSALESVDQMIETHKAIFPDKEIPLENIQALRTELAEGTQDMSVLQPLRSAWKPVKRTSPRRNSDPTPSH